MRNAVTIPLKKLSHFLRDTSDRVILRNPDYVANLERGGDIDLLVGDLSTIRQEAIERFGPPKIFIKRSYVHGLYWPWGYLDFLPRLEWHGAQYIPREELFEKAFSNDQGIKQVHPVHEALICWFPSLIWGGFFKNRYRELVVRVAMEYEEDFLAALVHAVGPGWGKKLLEIAQKGIPEASVRWKSSLRCALWWRAFRRDPLRTLWGWMSFLLVEISLRLSPAVPWVAILGLDGSGKSSVIQGLRECYGQSRFLAGVCVKHWRPGLFLSGKDKGPVINPHGKPPRGRWMSLVKLLFLFFDWSFGYWTRLTDSRAKGQLLLFDRHFVDLLVDPKRYRYGAPMWLARLVAPFVPKPNLFIFLDLPSDVARVRKPEVTLEEAGRLREGYLQMAQSLENAHVVDASRPLEEVVLEVKRIVMDHMEAHTHRRLLNGSDAVEAVLKRPRTADSLKWLEKALNVRLNPAGGIKFGMVSLPDGRGYLIPLSNKQAAVKALSFYGAQSLKARAGKHILRSGLILRISQQWLPKVRLEGLDSDQEDSLLRLLKNLFGRSELEFAVSLGTPGPQRKPVVQVLSRHGEVLGFAKVGWNAITSSLVENEAHALNSLGDFSLQHSVFPQVRHYSQWNGRVLLVTSPLNIFLKAGNPRGLKKMHIQCLEELAQADLEYAPFKESFFWRTIRERVKRIEEAIPSNQKNILKQAMTLLERCLGDEALPWIWRLGDFTPWNVQLDGRTSKLHIIDLEYASRCWLPGWDLFHFLSSNQGTIPKAKRVDDWQHIELVHRYFQRLSVPRGVIEMLRLGYLVDLYSAWTEMWQTSGQEKTFVSNRELKNLSSSIERISVLLRREKSL